MPRPLANIDLSSLAAGLDDGPEMPRLEQEHDDSEVSEEEQFEGEEEQGPFDFDDDDGSQEDPEVEEPTSPATRAPTSSDRWSFETAPKGQPVKGYGGFESAVGAFYPPIWPGHARYQDGTTILQVQRMDNSSGYVQDIGTLPGDANVVTLVKKFKKAGDYRLWPVDHLGEKLTQQPIRQQIAQGHDAFKLIAEEAASAEALVGGMPMTFRSVGGGDHAAFKLLQESLRAERAERHMHQGKAETAAERVVRAHELGTNRVLTELEKLNQARVEVERSLGTAQTTMLREQNDLASRLQEKLMADQARAYEKMAEAHKSVGEEQARAARENAARAENLAREAATSASSTTNSVMAMMMAFMQSSQARAEQDLARQQAQMQIEMQRQQLAAEQARAEHQARMAAEEARRAQEREDRKARLEEMEAQHRREEAERRRLREEAEIEERKARQRREEQAELREQERERREADMERLRLTMLEKAKPPDPTTWITGATVAITALSKLAPVVRELFGGGGGDEGSSDKPSTMVEVVSQAIQALPALLQARNQQMQLELAAAQSGLLPGPQGEGDNDPDEDEEDDDEMTDQPGYVYQQPKPRLTAAPTAPPPAAAPVPPAAVVPYPVQRKVREALQNLARAVERDPSLDVAGVQNLILTTVTPVAGEFLQFAQWRGSLSATVAEGRPSAEASARIMAALDSYTGPGADFLKRLPR